jgi:membrane protein DedA with SNARE-associated domain
MIIYSSISIALWNGLLIYFAVGLHNNWQNLHEFFVIYNRIILGLFILGLVIILAILLKKRLESKNEKGR